VASPRGRARGRAALPDQAGTRLAGVDRALATVARAFPDAARVDVILPTGQALAICATPNAATTYRADCLAFDQYTGRQVGTDFHRDRNAGERLQALNHDLHVGRIAGLAGRIVAFLGSLVAASLPITGAVI
jgi:uncharacterized iron-regulated membrane protein